MLATTVVASVVFAVVYVIIVHRVITLDQIPFLPRYEHGALSGAAAGGVAHNKKSKAERPCFLCRLNTPCLTGPRGSPSVLTVECVLAR